MGKTKRSSHRRTASEEKTARQHETATKLRGELAELAFAMKAVSLGFGLAKPYGDSQRFDFILRSGSKLSRVQVKSTTTLLNGLYRINAHRRIGGRAIAYLPSEVDFLVAYIIPERVWFVLPIQDILTRTSLLFCPKGYPRAGINEPYREAWHLLRESK
jgi:hypothetical protein